MADIDALHARMWTESEGSPLSTEDIDATIGALVASEMPLSTEADRSRVERALRARVNGLGPLEPLVRDRSVTEVIVNAGSEVWVERGGELERASLRIDAAEVEQLVRRLASAAGRRIDRTSPSVEVRLDDGSRLHALLPPLAIDGPCLTIRRFAPVDRQLSDMATQAAAGLLARAVVGRASIVVAGGTSSGKTTLLNCLGAHLGPTERVITIEDAAELQLDCRHVVRLETRGATEGAPAVGLRELVRHALRMRPDRIVCGEMRGAEALDLVQAMNTGHPGSMTTVHANSPLDALRRIETMMMTADAALPHQAVREQLASCIDLIVMTARVASGARAVVEIAEVPSEAADRWRPRTLFGREGLGEPPGRPWSDR